MTILMDEQRSLISPFDSEPLERGDDRVMTLRGGWEHFEWIERGCADNPGVRLFYWNGTIEIVMPGQLHEIFGHAIGTLLTLFFSYQGLSFFATGSADQKKPGVAAAQPDQSYCIGTLKPIPDLSIEVVFTSGGVEKLARYGAIGVREVWFWEDGILELFHWRESRYVRVMRSELEGLEDLDLEVLRRHVLMAETNLGEAVRSFIQYLSSMSETARE